MNKNRQPHLSYKLIDGPVDILHWFTSLEKLPWAMLLHSEGELRSDSRFDILTAAPLATITSDGINSTITHYADEVATKQYQQPGDPLAHAQQLQQKLFGNQADWPGSHLPFIGGAMGALSYDLGRSIESLPEIAANDISLPQLALGFYDWALIADKQLNTLTLVQMGDSAKLEQRLGWLLDKQQPQSGNAPFRLTASWQANMDKAGYTQRFNQVQRYLLSGDCYQINLAQRFSAPYQGEEWQAYQQLIKENKTPFSAFIRFDNATILSVSPERFMQVKHAETGFRVQTKPIKGTRPRQHETQADQAEIQALTASAKDRAENLMIVDLLRNDISRVCQPGSVTVPELFAIESYAAVHHMVSTIEGELQADKTAWDLLRATFPGGSITGAPKIRAMQIIEELEPQRRSLYCGSIVHISANGEMDSNITIRTLIAEKNRLYCWGGGGLVADSNVESEYQETLDKLAKILPTLQNVTND